MRKDKRHAHKMDFIYKSVDYPQLPPQWMFWLPAPPLADTWNKLLKLPELQFFYVKVEMP